MPSPFTLSHLLVALGLLDAFAAAMFGVSATRNQGYMIGTPQYARERHAKRTALILLGSAALFILVGLFTPLADIVLIGDGE